MAKGGEDFNSIPASALVRVTKMNHIVEVQYMTKSNNKSNIRKLNANQYLEISTGEIKEFKHSENRSENHNSLRQTFKKLRYLINNNFVGANNELHVTLTYKENMTDTKRLYADFKRFMTRLKRKYEKQTTIDYISVIEPQERGAWHCHLLARFNDLEKIYIPNKWNDDNPIDSPLYDMWQQGYVTIKSLKNVDNIGAYLSAYLADVELTDENQEELLASILSNNKKVEDIVFVEKEVDGVKKQIIKGGRLHMYPPGMNLYRKSRGIEFPDRENMTFKDIKKVVGLAEPHYSKTYHVENEGFEKDITFLQYNTKRKE